MTRKRELEQRRDLERQIDGQLRDDEDKPNRRERRSAIKRSRVRAAK